MHVVCGGHGRMGGAIRDGGSGGCALGGRNTVAELCAGGGDEEDATGRGLALQGGGPRDAGAGGRAGKAARAAADDSADTEGVLQAAPAYHSQPHCSR